jgi:hypothetical protein
MNKKDGNRAVSRIEIDLTLPEADIKGLHFNETKVKAFFELKDDGCYYSRDILFLSARQTDEAGSGDILTEYLGTGAFRQAVFNALPADMKPDNASQIAVFIPEENQGIKRYNGVTWWYWLRKPSGTDSFAFVYYNGSNGNFSASGVGGCAPAFRVAEQH